MSADSAALELHGITRRFGEVVALDGARLRVEAGSIHAVLGENGAGKTTLMRIAYGMVRPTSGTLFVRGQPRQFTSPAAAIAAGIGMVQQHPVNVPALSVWENVVLGGSGSLGRSQAQREVADLATSVGFDFDVTAPVGELSVAMQQRVEILRAIHRKARILLLDEPTAILAPQEARDLYAWLRRFTDGGGTAIVVTHKLDEAQRSTDSLTVLRRGRTVLECKSAASSRQSLAQAMLGEAVESGIRLRSTEATGAVLLRAVSLHIRNRGAPAIRNASFEIRSGEIVGVAGVEGSGHHELLLAAAGRKAVDGGSVELPSAVSFIPEDRHRDAVVLDFSLVENAAISGAGARRGRVSWGTIKDEVADLIARYDVRAPSTRTKMRVLSGGNQQKFVLGRELDRNPQLIVAENPTRGLDIRAASFVRDQLRAARARGAAVLVYSSDLDELMEMADRMLVVYGGTVSEEPVNRERVGAVMLGAT